MDLKLVIFDLDCTLIDSLPLYSYASSIAFPGLTKNELKTQGLEIGRRIGELPDNKLVNEEQLKQWLEGWYSKEAEDLIRIPNETLDLLEWLKTKHILVAILTNRPYFEDEVRRVLKRFRINKYINDVHTQVTSARKPNPLGINLLLEKYNLKKNNAVFIGDDISDIEAGKNAGIPIFAISTGIYSFDLLKKLNPDRCFYSLEEIKKHLKEMT